MALAVGADGQELLRGPHQAGGELRRRARAGCSARSAGRSRTASRPRPSRRRSPASSRRRASPTINGDNASARACGAATADEFQRNLKKWTLTTQRAAEPEPVLHPPVEERRPERGHHLQRRQRRPDARPARGHRRRLPGVRAARRAAGRRRRHRRARWPWSTRPSAQHRQRRRLPPLQRRRLRRRRRPTAARGRRSNKGTGHLWPVLAGERGQYELDRGKLGAAVGAPGRACATMASGVGLIPEQAWDLPRPRALRRSAPTRRSPRSASGTASRAGSASALTWSAGQFVRLTLDTAAGCVLDRPAYTVDRYVRHTQGQPPRPDGHGAGRQHPRRQLRDGDRHDDHRRRPPTPTPTSRRPYASDGSFSVTCTARRRHLRAQHRGLRGPRHPRAHGGLRPAAGNRSSSRPTIPTTTTTGRATTPIPRTRPSTPGAFDIQHFAVYDAGPSVVFQLRTRDLTPTFGPLLGAQLGRRLRPRAGRKRDLDGRGVPGAPLRDRPRVATDADRPERRLAGVDEALAEALHLDQLLHAPPGAIA